MSEQITELLLAWNNGEKTALERLIPVVEKELRRIAHNYMRRENSNHTLQTTALVNEAYIQLANQHSVSWQSRAHFFALSAQIMRRVLLKHARTRSCAKRGGGSPTVCVDEISVLTKENSEELIALDEALSRLAQIDALKSQIVEMRYFGGLTIDEVASVTGLAAITVSVHWRLAKAWLRREMSGQHAAKYQQAKAA